MPVTFSALQTELLTDPAGFGYSTFITTGNDNGLADLLNRIGSSTITVGTVYAISMQQCVSIGEYNGLTATQRDLWGVIIATAVAGLAISNTLIRQQIGGIWSATTTTRSLLSNLQTRPCSRAEFLFGEGAAVNVTEVSKAKMP